MKVLRFIDSFIPDDLRQYDHPEYIYRARVMLAIPFAVGASHLYSCLLMYQNLDELGPLRWVLWVALLASALLFLSVALFRRGAPFVLCTHIYAVGATTAIASVIMVTGGYQVSPFVILLPLMVLFVFIMARITTAIFWAAVALGMWWLGVTLDDRVYPNLISEAWLPAVSKATVLNAGITMMGILWFFDLFHRQLLSKLQVERDRALFSAAHDALTGLVNRTTFHNRLRYLIENQDVSGGLHALLLMDLDDFKIINDTYGHATGDYMLKAVSAGLATSVRRSDMAARLGGDEFGILLCDVRSSADLVPILDKIHQVVTSSVTLVDGRQVAVGASIGVALLPDDGDDPEELLHLADQAMYRAKGTASGYRFVRDDPGG